MVDNLVENNTMCLPPIDILPVWASFKQCDYEQYATW